MAKPQYEVVFCISDDEIVEEVVEKPVKRRKVSSTDVPKKVDGARDGTLTIVESVDANSISMIDSASVSWPTDPLKDVVSEVNDENGETAHVTINGIIAEADDETDDDDHGIPPMTIDDVIGEALAEDNSSESSGCEEGPALKRPLQAQTTTHIAKHFELFNRPLVDFSKFCCLCCKMTKVRFMSKYWLNKERNQIVTDGRKTPNLNQLRITEVDYQRLDWITGCAKLQKVYCWPCLLFGFQQVWCCDFKVRSNMFVNAEMHSRSLQHQASVECLELWDINCSDDFDVSKYVREIRRKYNTRKHALKIKKVKKSANLQQQRLEVGYSLIQELLKYPILENYWSEEDRKSVIVKGRPIPKVDKDTHGIDEQDFEKIPWLTGCLKLNKAYCWPCLLFQRDGMWAKSGYALSKMATSNRHHESVPEHIEASLQLKLMESKLNILPKSLTSQAKDIDQVKTNRRLLKHVIDVVCLLKKRVENVQSSWDEYVELVKLTTPHDMKLNQKLKQKCEAASASSEDFVSDFVLNHVEGVLGAIVSVMRSRIKKEMDECTYMSLYIDDSSNMVKKSSAALILRYVDKGGRCHETFHDFVNLSYERSSEELFDSVCSATKELNLQRKLVGFTHDGIVLSPSQMQNFHFRMMCAYPLAKFFHYPEHDLRKTLLQSLSHEKDHQNFYWNLSEISKFLEASPNAMTFLKAENEIDPLGWAQLDTAAGHVMAIKAFYPAMIKLFEVIIALPENWESDAPLKAPHFLAFLQDSDNRFMLVLVARLLKEIEELTTLLQTVSDVSAWIHCSSRTVQNLGRLKNEGYDEVFKISQIPSLRDEHDPLFGFMSNGEEMNDEPMNPMYKEVYEQVITSASNIIVQRTKDFENFEYFELLKVDKLRDVHKLQKARLNPTPLLDPELLSSQLSFLTKTGLLKTKSPNELIEYFNELEMAGTLSDVHKLLQLALTLPLMETNEKRVNAVKQMATYVKHNPTLNPTDAFLYMERDLLQQMQTEATFHDDVIETYAQTIGAFNDYVYKKRL